MLWRESTLMLWRDEESRLRKWSGAFMEVLSGVRVASGKSDAVAATRDQDEGEGESKMKNQRGLEYDVN